MVKERIILLDDSSIDSGEQIDFGPIDISKSYQINIYAFLPYVPLSYDTFPDPPIFPTFSALKADLYFLDNGTVSLPINMAEVEHCLFSISSDIGADILSFYGLDKNKCILKITNEYSVSTISNLTVILEKVIL